MKSMGLNHFGHKITQVNNDPMMYVTDLETEEKSGLHFSVNAVNIDIDKVN